MPQSIWTTPITLEELELRCQNSLSSFLGIIFTEIGPDYLEAKLSISPKTVQPMGILHGGASCALAETVASAAANYVIDQSQFFCVGIELNINHIKAVKEGLIFARATPLHIGKTTQVWDIQVRTERGERTAVSRLTLSVLQRNKKTR